MFDFELHQISGMQPSLLVNRLGVDEKTIRLLFAKIGLLPNGCWLWLAAKRQGYGAVRIRALSDGVMPAHRVCYQLVYGRLDPELDLHHKVEDGCIGPACVNPSHLLPVTKGEHTTEFTPNSIAYKNAHQTQCKNGHPYTDDSTRILKNGTRQCRICDQKKALSIRERERGDRKKYSKDPSTYKTHCKRGHELSGDNIRMVKTNSGPQRRCVMCEREREALYCESGVTHQPTKEFCKHGHPLSGDNVFIRPNGFVGCKACRLAAVKKNQAVDHEAYLKRRAELRKKKSEVDLKSRIAVGLSGDELIQRLCAVIPPSEAVVS